MRWCRTCPPAPGLVHVALCPEVPCAAVFQSLAVYLLHFFIYMRVDGRAVAIAWLLEAYKVAILQTGWELQLEAPSYSQGSRGHHHRAPESGLAAVIWSEVRPGSCPDTPVYRASPSWVEIQSTYPESLKHKPDRTLPPCALTWKTQSPPFPVACRSFGENWSPSCSHLKGLERCPQRLTGRGFSPPSTH